MNVSGTCENISELVTVWSICRYKPTDKQVKSSDYCHRKHPIGASQSKFLKGALVGGQTWDLFDFRLFSLTNAAP